jgi:hypothetical protein
MPECFAPLGDICSLPCEEIWSLASPFFANACSAVAIIVVDAIVAITRAMVNSANFAFITLCDVKVLYKKAVYDIISMVFIATYMFVLV